MASPLQPLSPLLLLIATAIAVALLIPPAHSSLTCTSQTFHTKFTNCTNLPTLNATLHWTYNPTTPTPTLSIAFVAPPPNPNGWVAWALNPTGPGMVGSQSLIAFKDATNGSIIVKTYNVSSYGPVSESKIAYEVLNKSGEYSGGVFRIFATLAVPVAEGEELSQVWQVGAAVKGGVPVKHGFSTENLGSKMKFGLVSGGAAAAPAPEEGGSTAAARSESGNSSSGGGGRLRVWGLYGVLVTLGVVSSFGI